MMNLDFLNEHNAKDRFPQFPLIFNARSQFFFEFSAIFGHLISENMVGPSLECDHKIKLSTNTILFTTKPS